jgi:hypothetical protein
MATGQASQAAARRRRLREVWRSAGWPCHDAIELELLASGLLCRHWDEAGRETLRVTEAGLQVLAAARLRAQAALDAHEALVARVAREMHHAGRVVWRGLALRAPLRAEPDATGETGSEPPTTWAMARPDVYSIRHTTLEDQTEPVAHEIKVSRADLLSDLRAPAKGAAYRALSSQCWYVLRAGIARADEVPSEYGVMFADEQALTVARPAPRRPLRLPFSVWMALARSAPDPATEPDAEPFQAALQPEQTPHA